MQELRWLYDRRNIDEARRDLMAWLQKWQRKYSKLCNWVEESIDKTRSFYTLPLTKFWLESESVLFDNLFGHRLSCLSYIHLHKADVAWTYEQAMAFFCRYL